MYPFFSSSRSHFFSASSSFGGKGYSLQSRVSGASGFSVMVWSHGRDRGNFFDSTGSKVFACLWYSFGTSMSWVNFLASLDSSTEIPLSEDSLSSSWNIASCCCCVFVRSLHPLIILAIMGLICDFLQSTDRMMMGRKEVSIAASLHLNLGSKVEPRDILRLGLPSQVCHEKFHDFLLCASMNFQIYTMRERTSFIGGSIYVPYLSWSFQGLTS